jgi:DNA-3-methyladenine glycosylase I
MSPRRKEYPMNEPARCAWATNDLAIAYHDREWGVPIHDDRTLFEFLILEGAQAGLSWDTVLRKRERYREVFDGFDPLIVARYDGAKQQQLLIDPGIIRNRAKVAAAVQNALAFLDVQQELGSFDAYIWRFIGGRPCVNAWRTLAEIPTRTPAAEAMSRDLKRRGFSFVGPTICYAFMQATGMVNDHLTSCDRHRQVQRARL